MKQRKIVKRQATNSLIWLRANLTYRIVSSLLDGTAGDSDDKK